MTGRPRRALPVVLGVGVGLSACAALLPPPAPPDPAAVAVTHRQRAETLEQEGHLRRAREEWTLALTIQPDDARAQARRAELEARTERAVTERVRQAQDALARVDHDEARRQLLAALALDPGNRAAHRLLQTEVDHRRHVTHVVRAGETLATIAERYYGDRTQAETIAEANRVSAGVRLVVGRALRIPEVPGLPAMPGLAPVTPLGAPAEEFPPLTPRYVAALEAFERGEHTRALGEVNRLLTTTPQHAEGLDLKKAILYELGRYQLEIERWAESFRTLSELARLAPEYQDAAALLGRARTRLVERHYAEGLRLFQEERVAEAIAEWQRVLEYDADHATARRNVEQARRLLEGLEERRKQP